MTSPRDKLIIPLAFVVSVGWMSALISGVFTQNYAPFEISTPVMILLAGYVFGVQIVRSSGEKQ
jgi:hypothetical protein